jgi:hypothetical protein
MSGGKMISLLEFSEFWVDFFKNKKYPNERFGQAFYNTHVHDGIPNPDLFYTEDVEKAKDIIFERYVDIPNQTIQAPDSTAIDILNK